MPTASRVLSGSDYPVTAELRRRVQQAADTLDYVPNAQAQGLLLGNSTVGILVGDVGDPYFSEIVNGVHDAASAKRLLVTICNTDRDVDRELEYFRLLQAHRTGAVIIAGSGLADERYTRGMTSRIRSFQESGGRVVAIGSPTLNVSHVSVDNTAGARSLAEHMVGLGHANVGILAGMSNVESTIERVRGLRSVVEDAGGAVHVHYGAASRDGGHDGADHLTDAHPEITALVGSADQMAIGALAFARERDIAVPDQISVAGFNDIGVARDVHPPLTTVHLPLTDMGAAALELATTQSASNTVLTRQLEVELVVRDSTGPAPGSTAQ